MTRVAWTLWLLAGCDFTWTDDFAGPDETGEPPATSDTSPTPTGETGVVGTGLDCVDVWATPEGEQTVIGDTTGRSDLRRPRCHGNESIEDGPEVLIGFTAPTSGDWEFDLVETSTAFDSVLAVLASCDGLELGCNDDWPEGKSPTSFQSRVTVPLVAGQTVIVQVDGYSTSDYGPFDLAISAR